MSQTKPVASWLQDDRSMVLLIGSTCSAQRDCAIREESAAPSPSMAFGECAMLYVNRVPKYLTAPYGPIKKKKKKKKMLQSPVSSTSSEVCKFQVFFSTLCFITKLFWEMPPTWGEGLIYMCLSGWMGHSSVTAEGRQNEHKGHFHGQMLSESRVHSTQPRERAGVSPRLQNLAG